MTRWIPVEERLPEAETWVLGWLEYRQAHDVVTWDDVDERWWHTYRGTLPESAVTHWQPLPDPPGAETHLTKKPCPACGGTGDAMCGP